MKYKLLLLLLLLCDIFQTFAISSPESRLLSVAAEINLGHERFYISVIYGIAHAV